MDVTYRKRFGARVSAAGWYDGAYGGQSQTNPSAPLNAIPSYINKQYSNYTDRFYHGPSGELLDAFMFGGVDLGEVPVHAKLGRHSVYWGESLCWAAICTASLMRRTRWICRRVSPHPVSRPRNCSGR